MRNYVIINGVNSNTINGLAINELPPITKPPMRVLQEEIDGRDGDITTNLGYGAYDKVMTIGLFHTFDINQIIAFFNGSGTIVFSNEPDKKYNYKIIDQIDYEKLISFKTATVTFHCQPFKYPVEEEPIEVTYTYVEGEGETLTLTPTSEAPMEIDLKGNTSQDTTTGKNLIPTQESAWEQGGIDYQTGGNTSNTARLRTIDYYPIQKDTDYYVSVQNTGYSFLNIYLYNSSKTYVTNYSGYYPAINGATALKINITSSTFQDSISYMRVVMQKGDGTSTITPSDITTIKPQIELGSSKTSWEEYSGGNPAPNPSYPQPINVVTGDNYINVCGKNMFNPSFMPSKINTTVNGENITIADNSGWSQSYFVGGWQFKEGNYAIRIVGNEGTFRLLVRGIKNGEIYESKIGTGSYNTYYKCTIFATFDSTTTVSLPNTCDYYYIGLVLGRNGTETIKLMVEKSNSASEYEPYAGQTQLISLGVENLWDNSIGTQNAYLDNSGVSVLANDWLCTNYIEIKPNSHYWGGFTNMGARFIWCEYTSSKTAIGGRKENTTGEIKTSSTAQYIRFCTNNPSATDITLVKGNLPSRVSANPIELCKIGDYQDYFYKDNGSWYLHKEIGKVVLDGTQVVSVSNWRASETSVGWLYPYNIANNFIPSTDKQLGLVIADKLKEQQVYDMYYKNVDNGIGLINSNTYSFVIRTSDTTLTNNTAINNYLSSNPITAHYVLATPTNTIIEDTELISQLDNLQGAMSYTGQTNIMQVPYDKPFILKVKASKDDSGIATINNIGNIYSKPTIALEGNGTGGIYLNDNQILSVELTDKMTISISDMEAFDPDTHALLNRYVTGNYNSMTLQPNENTIKITGGITKATITDYTRWL